jgi:hypothetical protein
MTNLILGYIDDLRTHTELLESLNWDEELMVEFIDELNTMLLAAPPNVDKALFWLKNTPWDCFDGAVLPEPVAAAIEKSIRKTELAIMEEASVKEKKRLYALPNLTEKNDDTEWN